MTNLTIAPALLGGILIGLAAGLYLAVNGRIAGISGIVGSLLSRPAPGQLRNLAFVGGMLAGGLGLVWFHPQAFPDELDRSSGLLIAAGLLVGFGTRLGSGCTSGHGVCGMGRLSPRSLVATVTFIASGVITVLVVRGVGG